MWNLFAALGFIEKPIKNELHYIKTLCDDNPKLNKIGEVLLGLFEESNIPRYTVFLHNGILTFDTKNDYDKFCVDYKVDDEVPPAWPEWSLAHCKIAFDDDDELPFAVLLYKKIIRMKGYDLYSTGGVSMLFRESIQPHFNIDCVSTGFVFTYSKY